MNDIGKRIRMVRKSFKMSQSELGDVLGVSFQQIQKYEKGKDRLSCDYLIKISKFFGLPASYFLFGFGWESVEATVKINQIRNIIKKGDETDNVIKSIKKILC